MRSYGVAIIFSVIGHGVLVWLVVLGWSVATEKTIINKPNYIKATLVEFEPKTKPIKSVVQESKPPTLDNTQKQQDAAKEKRQQQAEKRKSEQKKREQKKAAEEKVHKNQLAKKREEDKKKADAKRKKQEQIKQQKQQKQQKEEEEQRKAVLQKEAEEERKRDLDKRINAEKARIEEAEQAANDEELVAAYGNIINEKVSANWSRPASARNGMSALVRIQLVPTGKVINVSVAESSGDLAFDRAAVLAVNKADSFPALQNMPNHVFEKNFRVFTLYFKPEDLRQ
jgi:colicin import membrane protein